MATMGMKLGRAEDARRVVEGRQAEDGRSQVDDLRVPWAVIRNTVYECSKEGNTGRTNFQSLKRSRTLM